MGVLENLPVLVHHRELLSHLTPVIEIWILEYPVKVVSALMVYEVRTNRGKTFYPIEAKSTNPQELRYTDKKESQIFLLFKEIQNGAVAKS